MSLNQIAKDYLGMGLNPVPVRKGTKEPIRKEHPTPIMLEDIDNFEWNEIGISTGYSSNNLEVLDFDLKNSEDPEKFLKDFMDLVGEELLQKLVVQSTPSGGYHFIYRCDVIESSQKLAKNKEGHAILETRGIGGYIKCYPSEGYEMSKKEFKDIPFITSGERFKLFISGRKLNMLIKEDTANRIPEEQREYVSKFPEYDGDPQIGLDLLEKHGWTEHSRTSDWINFTRPGKDISDGLSAGYNLDGNFLYVFSTSQDWFHTDRPYDNHSIFAELECKGNYSVAYGKLSDEGYLVDNDDDSENIVDLLSSEIEENEYLDQARKGEIEFGLTTGWNIDENFRFKRNSLNMGLGYENVGKSVFMTSMMSASAVLHGWKWGMLAPENRNPVNRRRFIETLSGKPIEFFKGDKELHDTFLKYSREKFKIVKNKKHYSVTEAIEIAKRLYEYEGIDAMLIEPWNFFRVDSNNAHMHNNKVLSELRVFVENYCSVYLMGHPYSEATRNNTDKEGYMLPPNRYQLEGGASTSYRVDDFFTVHRVTNHPSDMIRRSLQFIVEKVKEYDTGGKIHDKGDYTALIYEERDGFLGYWDSDGNNPMYKSLSSKLGPSGLKRSGLGDRITRKRIF